MFLLCCDMNCWLECKDWVIFVLGVLVTIGWAIFIYYKFRPTLEIGIPSFDKEENGEIISVPIRNISKKRKATRVKVEVAVLEGNYTYHMLVDSNDFAFIPPNQEKTDNERIFKSYRLNDFLINIKQYDFHEVIEKLNNQDCALRVRVHATDSFSGLGETFEECFEAKNRDFRNKGFITKNK